MLDIGQGRPKQTPLSKPKIRSQQERSKQETVSAVPDAYPLRREAARSEFGLRDRGKPVAQKESVPVAIRTANAEVRAHVACTRSCSTSSTPSIPV